MEGARRWTEVGGGGTAPERGGRRALAEDGADGAGELAGNVGDEQMDSVPDTSRPPITTVRTSAAVAPNTAASSATSLPAPAVRALSSDTVTRSAQAPGAISPASGQPRLACPAQVAASSSVSAVKWPRARRASRSAYSTPRASSSMSITAWLSLPRVSVQPAAASARAGARPSPRSRSVVGHRQANTPLPPSRSRSAASTWVACTTVVRGPSTSASYSSLLGETP